MCKSKMENTLKMLLEFIKYKIVNQLRSIIRKYSYLSFRFHLVLFLSIYSFQMVAEYSIDYNFRCTLLLSLSTLTR